jgi:flagellum-specific ATP synthase
MPETPTLGRYLDRVRTADPYSVGGRVAEVVGLVIEAIGPEAEVGEICTIQPSRNGEPVHAQVVGFRDNRTLLMPLGSMEGIRPGAEIVASGRPLLAPAGSGLLGRVIDGLGRPIDGKGPLGPDVSLVSVDGRPPSPLSRKPIDERLSLGVRALDAVVPCGRGQRMGIFAGSGVGKSTLLGMIARNTQAQVNVISLVGERGREVREFVENDLGPEGLARSVVIVATSDEPALVRVSSAFLSMRIAEHFRDEGADVLLMMDSVTRFAMAQREIGLAVGEPPASRGYTPSVFALLPRLLERAGTSDAGTITALCTVLVDGDDMNEPIADAVRGILDGHIVLSRDLAHRNHYPAIDVLASVSRVASKITTPESREAAGRLREVLATYRRKEDLITIGAYQPGSDVRTDYAIAKVDELNGFLKQPPHTREEAQIAEARLATLLADAPALIAG